MRTAWAVTMSVTVPGVRITVLIMIGASSGFASRGHFSEGEGSDPITDILLNSCIAVMGSDPITELLRW